VIDVPGLKAVLNENLDGADLPALTFDMRGFSLTFDKTSFKKCDKFKMERLYQSEDIDYPYFKLRGTFTL